MYSIIGFSICAAGLIFFYQYRLNKKDIFLSKTEKKSELLEQKINNAFSEVIELAKNNDSTFFKRFSEVYPEFVSELIQAHPDLVNSELALCAMVFLNFSSKEIAQYTFVEHRSAQTRRSRLRKKLQLPAKADLYQYLKTFDVSLNS